MVLDEILQGKVLRGEYIERMTDDEFYFFCQDNKDFKFERTSEGKIILMSPIGFLTSDQNDEISYQLRKWNKKFKLGRTVNSEAGFYLKNGSMRAPDACWISNDRLKNLSKSELKKFPHLCPDFVIELKSESDHLPDLKEKMKMWMSNGCQLGWLIDASEEIVYIYEGQTVREHKNFDNPLSGEPVLSGFTMILSELRV